MRKPFTNFILMAGQRLHWVGLLVILYSVVPLAGAGYFYSGARPVEARVISVESICRIDLGEELDCARALAMVIADQSLADDLKEFPRTLLAYRGPDGRPRQSLSAHSFLVDGRPARQGDILEARVAGDDFSDIRPVFNPARYSFFYWAILGGVACLIVGPRLHRIGERMLRSGIVAKLEEEGFAAPSPPSPAGEARVPPGRDHTEGVVQRMR